MLKDVALVVGGAILGMVLLWVVVYRAMLGALRGANI